MPIREIRGLKTSPSLHPMKVIQILPELNAGGVERGTLEVGKYLVEQGHESLVISNGGRQVAQLEAEGSRHITATRS